MEAIPMCQLGINKIIKFQSNTPIFIYD